MARRVSSQEVRRIAYKTVESPTGTDLVGVYINSIAKQNKKKLTPDEKSSIDWWQFNVDDKVPLRVFKFIKKKCYLVEYAEFVRKAIIEKLIVREEYCTEDIIKYASFFNLKTISKLDFLKSENLSILLMAVAVDEFDEYGEVLRNEGSAEKLERICLNLGLIDCNNVRTLEENMVYINALNSVLNILNSKLKLGD